MSPSIFCVSSVNFRHFTLGFYDFIQNNWFNKDSPKKSLRVFSLNQKSRIHRLTKILFSHFEITNFSWWPCYPPSEISLAQLLCFFASEMPQETYFIDTSRRKMSSNNLSQPSYSTVEDHRRVYDYEDPDYTYYEKPPELPNRNRHSYNVRLIVFESYFLFHGYLPK